MPKFDTSFNFGFNKKSKAKKGTAKKNKGTKATGSKGGRKPAGGGS